MAKGLSIHIGLNSVDAGAYGGWPGTLKACELDARDMWDLAVSKGFSSRLLLTAQATSNALFAALEEAATNLAGGDILFLTYSGHGGQVPDTNGDEEDGLDETWVLYDREVIDDELYGAWARFKPGVRIVILSDSCHSGTVERFMEYDRIRATHMLAGAFGPSLTHRSAPEIAGAFAAAAAPARIPDVNQFGDAKAVPEDVQVRYYAAHAREFAAAEKTYADGRKTKVDASVILVAGCQDDQLSGDGTRNGVFTGCVRKVWSEGGFDSYGTWFQAIQKQMPSWQSPNLDTAGAPNAAFLAQRPLTI